MHLTDDIEEIVLRLIDLGSPLHIGVEDRSNLLRGKLHATDDIADTISSCLVIHMSKELIGLSIHLPKSSARIINGIIRIGDVKDHGNSLSTRILGRINKTLVVQEGIQTAGISLSRLGTIEGIGIRDHIPRSGDDLIQVSVIDHLGTRSDIGTREHLNHFTEEGIGSLLRLELIVIILLQEFLIGDADDRVLIRELLAELNGVLHATNVIVESKEEDTDNILVIHLLEVLGQDGHRGRARTALSGTHQDDSLIIIRDNLVQIQSTSLQIIEKHLTTDSSLFTTTTKAIVGGAKDHNLVLILRRQILGGAVDHVALVLVIPDRHQVDDSLIAGCPTSDNREAKH